MSYRVTVLPAQKDDFEGYSAFLDLSRAAFYLLPLGISQMVSKPKHLLVHLRARLPQLHLAVQAQAVCQQTPSPASFSVESHYLLLGPFPKQTGHHTVEVMHGLFPEFAGVFGDQGPFLPNMGFILIYILTVSICLACMLPPVTSQPSQHRGEGFKSG